MKEENPRSLLVSLGLHRDADPDPSLLEAPQLSVPSPGRGQQQRDVGSVRPAQVTLPK